MRDPTEINDDQVPAAGRRPRRSRRWLIAAGVVPLVAAGTITATRDRSEPSVQVNASGATAATVATVPPSDIPLPVADEATTSTVTAPTTTATTAKASPTTTATVRATTTSTKPAPVRTPLMSASDGKWTLNRVDVGSRRCLELVAGTVTADGLLCDPAPAGGLWGGYVTVASPAVGNVVVAVVDPALTAMSALMGAPSPNPFAVDPDDPHVAYAVAVFDNGVTPIDLFLKKGEHTVGRVTVDRTAGPHPAPPIVTGAPYGIWPDYRRASSTGFFWGGNEEVGYYTPIGHDTSCVLWRRFGGPEEIILDVCPTAPTGTLFPFARLIVEPQSSTLVRPAIVIDAPNVTRWTCTWDTGQYCPGGIAIPSPAQPGRSLLAYFPGAFARNGTTLTVTAYNDAVVVGEITLAVPAE